MPMKIGDEVIINHRSALEGLRGFVYKEWEGRHIFGPRWWVFIPDKWREDLEWNEDPFLSVCWLLWEDWMNPWEGEDV